MQGARFTVTGHAVADPWVHFAPVDGLAVAKIRIGATPTYRDRHGAWRNATSVFLTITCFGQLAENVAETVLRATHVSATGRIRSTTWTDQDGTQRWGHDYVADQFAASLGHGIATVRALSPEQLCASA